MLKRHQWRDEGRTHAGQIMIRRVDDLKRGELLVGVQVPFRRGYATELPAQVALSLVECACGTLLVYRQNSIADKNAGLFLSADKYTRLWGRWSHALYLGMH